MAGRSPVTANKEQRATLKAMASGAGWAEADRARAILLTLSGWTVRRRMIWNRWRDFGLEGSGSVG